jgi:hypothetical protein
MQEMLDAGLSIWRDAPNMEWNVQDDFWIWRTALGNFEPRQNLIQQAGAFACLL